MARISGVDLPNEKRVEIGLTYIYGIGRATANKILSATGINPDTRVKDLTENEIASIRKYIEANFVVEGELRKDVALDIKRLKEIRKNEGLTQEKMAKRINTYRFLISDYETGRKSISTADLKQICETFGYSADWCVGKISDCIRYKPVHKLKAKDMKELIQVKQKEA